jgi:hypothetical protein
LGYFPALLHQGCGGIILTFEHGDWQWQNDAKKQCLKTKLSTNSDDGSLATVRRRKDSIA